jgi:hypothetical protein
VISLLAWLAADQARYTFAGEAPLFVLAGLAVAGMSLRRADAGLTTRGGTIAYLGLVALALMCARWPTLFVREPLNQDEAQALAQAITALHDPVPWRSFDGNTCGPLNTYVLMLPALFGVHLSFLTTRFIALALEFGSIASLYACATLTFDAALARVAVLPPVTFFALATQDHFVHYSGEHLSIFLGMLTLAFLCLASRRQLAGRWLFATGAAAGMMPFAKLQSVPLAGMSLAVACVVILFGTHNLRSLAERLGALVAGLVAPGALILLAALLGGSLRDFWLSYIQTSLAYILYDDQPLSFLTATPEFGPLFDILVAACGLGAIVLVARYASTTGRQRAAYAAAIVVLIGAIWSIYAPKRGSLNYLLFGVVPAAAAAAAALGIISVAFRVRSAGIVRGALGLAFVTAVLASEAAFDRPDYPYLGSFADYLHGKPDPVTALIAAHLRPGERLAIWGWRPKYFVTTYTLLGTRDAISAYQRDPDFNPYFTYFRERYVSDFEANQPAGFLDAGSDSFDFERRGRFGYEMFPQLATIVDHDYRLAGSANGIRLFIRRGHG